MARIRAQRIVGQEPSGVPIYGPDDEKMGVSGAGGLRIKPSALSSAPTSDFRLNSPGYVGNPNQALQWAPQSIRSTTSTSTRDISDLPALPEYAELDEGKVKSRTQEFSALGRRKAMTNFQDLLASIYGANPDDPYAKNLARTASQGFSTDVQSAITSGGREALSAGLQEQQAKNQRRMTAYSAAVNAVLSSGTTTTTQTHEYEPTPMQTVPNASVVPNMRQRALSKRYSNENPLSVGQPYTYG